MLTICCTVRDNSRVVKYCGNRRRRTKLPVRSSTCHGSFIMFYQWQIFTTQHEYLSMMNTLNLFNSTHCISPSFPRSYSHLSLCCRFQYSSCTTSRLLILIPLPLIPLFTHTPAISHAHSFVVDLWLFCSPLRLVSRFFFLFPSSQLWLVLFVLTFSPPLPFLCLFLLLSPLTFSSLFSPLLWIISSLLSSLSLLLFYFYLLFLISLFSHHTFFTFSSHVVSHLECFAFLSSYSFSLMAIFLPVYILLFVCSVPFCFTTHSPSLLFLMASPTPYTLEEQHIHTR